MTDEKIEQHAEEYFCEHCENSFEHDNGHCSNCSKWDYFIAGTKWGIANAIEWHDLREDSTDLPKESGEYWCKWEDGTYCTAHYFEVGGFCDCTIAWCELPQFKG